MNDKRNQQEAQSNVDRPGRILGSAHLKIQTRQAQRLVYGRRRSEDKNQIIGMLQFGFFVQKIWSGAAADDPYADWYLLRIHDALERGRDELGEMRKEIGERLKSVSNIQIEIAHSVEPILIPIQFPNPYGYMGAYLIADFDDLCIALLTARHFGLMDRNSVEKQLARAASVVRRTFMSSAGWKNTSVMRADFVVQTADGKVRIEQAAAAMGQCPPKILDGSLRSSMAPQIHRGAPNKASKAVVEDLDDSDAFLDAEEDTVFTEAAPAAVTTEPALEKAKPKIINKRAKLVSVPTEEVKTATAA